MAPSPSGKAEVCKTSIPGSIPGGASNIDPGTSSPDPLLALSRDSSDGKQTDKSRFVRVALPAVALAKAGRSRCFARSCISELRSRSFPIVPDRFRVRFRQNRDPTKALPATRPEARAVEISSSSTLDFFFLADF